MTWGDHIASLQQKVAKRIGLIKRISHLIPRAQCLMKTLQVLHNKCAKLILNMKPYDSSTKALDSLHWKSLNSIRKFHRCATIYKSIKNDISYTFSNKTGKDLHNIETRNSEQYYLPNVKANWGKQISSHLFIDDWNKLDTNIRLAGNFNIFEQMFWDTVNVFYNFL